jgi:hypothetical protein
MKIHKSLKRIIVTLGVTAGVLTVSAAQVSALGGPNHSEPTLTWK